MTTILAAAQDVGGANALVPVIERLRSYKRVRVAVLARGKAAGAFSAAGVDRRAVDYPTDFGPGLDEIVSRSLSEIAPDVLLLGTAWGPSIDKALLAAAQLAGVPSLAVLDMWSYYRDRFLDPESGKLVLPTRVALMDQLAFDEAREAGLPAASLVITGQPYLEAVATAINGRDIAAQATSLRAAWFANGAGQQETRLVLFASEAFSRDLGPETSYYRGYTEVEALDGVVEAVELAARRGKMTTKVIAKLHPKESIESFHLGPVARENDVLVVADQPAWPCILAADAIVGMTSMFLLESAIAGKSTISFQPGAAHPESFVGTRVGMVPAASSVEELATLLTESLDEGPVPRATQGTSGADIVGVFAFQGAADRVADTVLRLAAKREVQHGAKVP